MLPIVNKRKYDPKYNFFIPISRPWAVPDLIKNIRNMDLPRRLINLYVLVDTDDFIFFDGVQSEFSRLNRQGKFASVKVEWTDKPTAGDSILERRQRIIEIWQHAQKNLPDVEYTFGLEDDTVPPRDAFTKLLGHIKQSACIFAQGIQMHRQSNSIGAWYIDNAFARTLLPDPKMTAQPINGGGLYCFMVRTEDLKKMKFRQSGPAFGPDVCFVYDLKKKYKFMFAIADFSIKCGHLLSPNILMYPWSPDVIGKLVYRRASLEDQILIEGGPSATA